MKAIGKIIRNSSAPLFTTLKIGALQKAARYAHGLARVRVVVDYIIRETVIFETLKNVDVMREFEVERVMGIGRHTTGARPTDVSFYSHLWVIESDVCGANPRLKLGKPDHPDLPD